MAHKNSPVAEYDGTALVRCPKDFEGELYIPDGITDIKENACLGCFSLTSVSFPAGLALVGAAAFADCISLANITFRGNSSPLTTATFPDGEPFRGCVELEQITLSDDTTKINNLCNAADSATTIVVSEENPAFTTVDGLLYNKECTEFVLCPRGRTGEVVLLNSVEKICPEAFASCKYIAHIQIPESVKEIGRWAFAECKQLKNLELPSGITEVSAFALSDCNSITELAIPEGVAYINKNAFERMSALKELSLPKSLSCIEDFAFADCSGLRSVRYNGTVEQWCNIQFEGVFSNPLFNRADLYIDGAPLKHVEFNGRTTEIGLSLMGCTSIETVKIPDSVEVIREGAFAGCKNLTDVYVGNGVEKILDCAFASCKKLQSLFIPASVIKMGERIAEDSGSVTIYCEDEPKESWSVDWNKKSSRSNKKHDIITHAPRWWYEKFVANRSAP